MLRNLDAAPTATTSQAGTALKTPAITEAPGPPQKAPTAPAAPSHTPAALPQEGPKPQCPDPGRRQTQKPDPTPPGPQQEPGRKTQDAGDQGQKGPLALAEPELPPPIPAPTAPQDTSTPTISYAATASKPTHQEPKDAKTASQPAPPQVPKKTKYPSIVAPVLPNWTKVVAQIAQELGRAVNAKSVGRGVRFELTEEKEYRTVFRHLSALGNGTITTQIRRRK